MSRLMKIILDEMDELDQLSFTRMEVSSLLGRALEKEKEIEHEEYLLNWLNRQYLDTKRLKWDTQFWSSARGCIDKVVAVYRESVFHPIETFVFQSGFEARTLRGRWVKKGKEDE